MGRRGQQFAAAYSAQAWAERWREYLKEAMSWPSCVIMP